MKVFAAPCLFALGCLPYASPPVSLTSSVGPALNVPAHRRRGPAPHKISGFSTFRLGVHPLGLSRGLSHRKLDPSFGLLVEGGLEDNTAQLGGGYVGLDWFPWQSSSRINRWRARTFTSFDFASLNQTDLEDQLAIGGTVGVGIEWVGFVGALPFATHSRGRHQENDLDVIGVARGEWGIGMILGSSFRVVTQEDIWSGFVGLTGRLPASIGFLCCFVPGD